MKNIKFFKIIALKILLLATIFNQGVFAKPIPPGSGEGDVPANILFLLDSSDSMDTNIFSGTPMRNAEDIVELNDGNLIVAQKREGLIKLIYSTTEKDYEFLIEDCEPTIIILSNAFINKKVYNVGLVLSLINCEFLTSTVLYNLIV